MNSLIQHLMTERKIKGKQPPKYESEEKQIKNSEPKNRDPLLPQHPFRMNICGSSGCGKTQFLLDNIILNKNSPFDHVIFVAPKFSLEQAKVQKAYKKMGGKMSLIEGIDEAKISEILDNQHAQGNQTLIVFDDLVNKKSKFMTDLFVSGRHRNASIIELTQRIFADGRRTNRCNVSYYVIFNFPDVLEFKNLAMQMYPSHWKEIMKLYENATEDSHGCLILDTVYNQNKKIAKEDRKKLRFRKNDFYEIYDYNF